MMHITQLPEALETLHASVDSSNEGDVDKTMQLLDLILNEPNKSLFSHIELSPVKKRNPQSFRQLFNDYQKLITYQDKGKDKNGKRKINGHAYIAYFPKELSMKPFIVLEVADESFHLPPPKKNYKVDATWLDARRCTLKFTGSSGQGANKHKYQLVFISILADGTMEELYRTEAFELASREKASKTRATKLKARAKDDGQEDDQSSPSPHAKRHKA